MSHYVVDLRSDTLSVPTPEMRKAMAEAVIGDDVYGEDPTVKELEQRSAKTFEKEAGLFVPSGTMGNLLAFMVHCHRRGTEAIAGDLSHTFLYEQGGCAHIAGVQLATIKNEPDGTFSLEELRRKIRLTDPHEPITSLVIVENTHNMCGGKVLPLEWLDELAAIVSDPTLAPSRIALHMDGARVFNAAEALQVPVARITRHFDSVCFCLSKGLSAPIGSVLVGSKAFISEAHRLRKALGGGMRQVGVIAATGLVALETIVPRLGEDHQKTRRLAEAVNKLQSPHFVVDLQNLHSNILLLNVKKPMRTITDVQTCLKETGKQGKLLTNGVGPNVTAAELVARLKEVTNQELLDGITADDGGKQGIVLKVSARNWEYSRLVVYHQISDKDIDLAIKKLEYVIKEFDRKLSA